MRQMQGALVNGLVFGLLLGAVACGGSSKPDVQTGPMPEGGSFTGVFFSPHYGEMHMIQDGAHVRGKYEKDERKGTIIGEADGNLLMFEWTEKKAMISNRPQETKGRGYFQYVVDPGNGEHKIMGRWGLEDDHSGGGPWNAYKSKSREPSLDANASGEGGEYYDEDLDSDSGDGDDGLEDDELF